MYDSAPFITLERSRTHISIVAPLLLRLLRLCQQPAVRQPVGEALGPGLDGDELGFRAHAEAVAAFGVEVAFDGALGLLVFGDLVEHGSDVALIIVGDEEKGGRGVGGDGAFWNAEGAGIDGDLEIATAVHAVDGVGGLWVACGGAVNEHGDGFTSGGKAHRADALGIEIPLGGAAADDAHGALDVLTRMDIEGIGRVGLAREAMLKHEGGDAEIVHEFGRFHAFAAEAELPMSATWDDDHGGSVGLVLGRGEHGDGGIVNVGDGGAFDDLGFILARLKSGRSFFPEMNDQRFVRASCGGDKTESDQGVMEFHGGECWNYRSPCIESTLEARAFP